MVIHNPALVDVAAMTAPHPEDFCQRCGRRNVVWSAPNDVWNKVMPDGGIVCPVCFIELAAAKGIEDVWDLSPRGACKMIPASQILGHPFGKPEESPPCIPPDLAGALREFQDWARHGAFLGDIDKKLAAAIDAAKSRGEL